MLYTQLRLAPYIFSNLSIFSKKEGLNKLTLVTRDLLCVTNSKETFLFKEKGKAVPLFRPWGDLLRETRITTKSAAFLCDRKIGDKVVVAEIIAEIALDIKLHKWMHESLEDGEYTVRSLLGEQNDLYFCIFVEDSGDVAFISRGICKAANKLILILQVFNFPVGFNKKEYKT